jgi:hypothetical protein
MQYMATRGEMDLKRSYGVPASALCTWCDRAQLRFERKEQVRTQA